MPLKFKLKSKDEIPAEFQSLYVERDGAFVLDVEGAADKSKVDEFRSNNVALKKQLDDLAAKYEGIDPDAVKTLLAEKAKLEEQRLIKDGEVEKLVERRIKAAVSDWEKRSLAAEQQLGALTARMVETEINRAAVEAAMKLGLRPGAIQDLQARAQKTYKIRDGAAKAFEGDGKTPVFGRDGVTSKLWQRQWVWNGLCPAVEFSSGPIGVRRAGVAFTLLALAILGDAVEEPFAAQVEFIVHQCRGGAEDVIEVGVEGGQHGPH